MKKYKAREKNGFTILHHIIVSDISLKTRSRGLHFCRRKFRYFNHFYTVRPESYRFHWSNAK